MGEKIITTFIIDRELQRDLKLYCVRNKISMSRFINNLIEKNIKEKNG